MLNSFCCSIALSYASFTGLIHAFTHVGVLLILFCNSNTNFCHLHTVGQYYIASLSQQVKYSGNPLLYSFGTNTTVDGSNTLILQFVHHSPQNLSFTWWIILLEGPKKRAHTHKNHTRWQFASRSYIQRCVFFAFLKKFTFFKSPRNNFSFVTLQTPSQKGQGERELDCSESYGTRQKYTRRTSNAL